MRHARRLIVAILSAVLAVAVAAPVASARRQAFLLTDLTGTASADARALGPPECDELSEKDYVMTGHYQASFRYTPRGALAFGGSERRARDSSIGPFIDIQSAPGKMTIRFQEDIGRLIGNGQGNGCSSTVVHCEGTRVDRTEGEAYTTAWGRNDVGTFRHGVRVDWPLQYFADDPGTCQVPGSIMETIAADGVEPVTSVPVRSFHRRPRAHSVTISTSRSGTLNDPTGPPASTADWTYKARMRFKRFPAA